MELDRFSKIGLFGGALGLVSMFLPWMNISIMGIGATVTGLAMIMDAASQGQILPALFASVPLIFSVVAILVSFAVKGRKKAYGLIGSGVGVIVVPAFFLLSRVLTGGSESGSMNFGLPLCLVAGVIVIAAGVMKIRE